MTHLLTPCGAAAVLTDVEVVLVVFGEGLGGGRAGEAALHPRGQRGHSVDLIFCQAQREGAVEELSRKTAAIIIIISSSSTIVISDRRTDRLTLRGLRRWNSELSRPWKWKRDLHTCSSLMEACRRTNTDSPTDNHASARLHNAALTHKGSVQLERGILGRDVEVREWGSDTHRVIVSLRIDQDNNVSLGLRRARLRKKSSPWSR